ncbi:helix-turn-helix domain-containing protein [Pedobacter sp. AW31-3R]|uniref:helix-turn-helix domain-containing protein n=1 Tax=Pedobacter sp. AW31-3R TaxID=3445781 RepID=UPI003FA19088
METTAKPINVHIGRKISRLREIRGIKQEALAIDVGLTQQAMSRIEQTGNVEDTLLEKIATALGISVEGIKNFNEEAVFTIISTTFNNNSTDDSTIIASTVNYQPTFNPLDKIVALYDEKVILLERLLQSEKEKVELLKNIKG